MSATATVNLAAPNNADGLWLRDVSAIAAIEPALAAAKWRIQVRGAAGDTDAYLDIPNEHGAIAYTGGVLTVSVPLSIMSRVPAGLYVWDGIYTTEDGRTVRWGAGDFVVQQGVTR